MNRLGSTIRELRLKKGMTEKQLGKKLGVSESYIIDVEQGRKIMGEAMAQRLNKILGATIDSEESQYYKETAAPKPTPAPAAKAAKPTKTESAPSPIWEQALRSIIADIPVYEGSANEPNGVYHLVMEGTKVMGVTPNSLEAYKVDSDDMTGYRICEGDLVFVHKVNTWEGDGIYLVLEDDERHFRHVSDDASGKRLTYSKVRPISYTIPESRVKPLGKAIKILINAE